jgi:hypothetical protein
MLDWPRRSAKPKSNNSQQRAGPINMSSAPSNFRRNDVKRAVQALQGAGLEVARVELYGGKVEEFEWIRLKLTTLPQ